MNQPISFTNARNHAITQFKAVQRRALLSSWLAKLLVKQNSLRSLVGSSASGLYAKRPTRTQRIRVDRIVGTIRYTEDFDQDFRPLKPQSRDHWVQAFLQLHQDQWQPIVVHRVGECYYVAHGHHQISVARYVGMKFIDAQVWDHSSGKMPQDVCTCMQSMSRQQKESFSTN